MDTRDFGSAAPDGLHVIVASASGSAGGHVQRAFFFDGSRFIRTDLVGSSATIQIAWRNDTTIGLSYATYQPTDRLCCPTAGAMIVRYRWTGRRLETLDPIPPPAARR